MNGAVEWDDLELVGAFVAGAILATVAVLRVVRAVTTLFQDAPLRRRRALPAEPDPPSTDTPDD